MDDGMNIRSVRYAFYFIVTIKTTALWGMMTRSLLHKYRLFR
jgi:hypothetical protein